MKELTEEFDIVWKKLRKYDLLPKESGKEAVAERKKLKFIYLQIKLKESRLKEREVMVKPGTDNPPKLLGIYGTPQDPLPCQDDY